MGYVKKTLAPGEKYLYRAHFNWTYDVTSWFWFALGCIPLAFWIYAFAQDYPYTAGLTGVYNFLSAAAFIFGALILLTRYIHKWTTVVAVTTVRLILKTGLVGRNAHEVSLDKIEEVLVHQSFIGRVLGYGTLTIRGTGMAVIEFPALARPMEIRRKIEEAAVRARDTGKLNAEDTAFSAS